MWTSLHEDQSTPHFVALHRGGRDPPPTCFAAEAWKPPPYLRSQPVHVQRGSRPLLPSPMGTLLTLQCVHRARLRHRHEVVFSQLHEDPTHTVHLPSEPFRTRHPHLTRGPTPVALMLAQRSHHLLLGVTLLWTFPESAAMASGPGSMKSSASVT